LASCPAPTHTPTATATSAPTPTPAIHIYLPASLRTVCKLRAVDVVLVVDVSSSMRRATGDGGTKLDLGIRVGAEILAGVDPSRWRAMVFLTDGMPNRVPTPEAGGSQEDTP
jgi:Mg-chelatase subunit ChlD